MAERAHQSKTEYLNGFSELQMSAVSHSTTRNSSQENNMVQSGVWVLTCFSGLTYPVENGKMMSMSNDRKMAIFKMEAPRFGLIARYKSGF